MPNYETLYNIKGADGFTLGSKFTKKGTNVVLTVAEFGTRYFSDTTGVDALYKIIDTKRNNTTNTAFTKVFSRRIKKFG